MTAEIREERKTVLTMSKIARNSKDKQIFSKLKSRKKILSRNIAETKKHFFNTKICNSSNINKTTWQIINSEVSNKNKKAAENIKLQLNKKKY